MQRKVFKWIVLLAVLEHLTSTTVLAQQFQIDTDYFYQDPELVDALGPNEETQQQAKHFNAGISNPSMNIPVAAAEDEAPDSSPQLADEPTTSTICYETSTSVQPNDASSPTASTPMPAPSVPSPSPTPSISPSFSPSSADSSAGSIDQEEKFKELRTLVQHLYVAQARVQLEANEIKKAQSVANAAQQELEDAANHVRIITTSLQNAQQAVAAAAIRAQTAQLQLAAHDQLLFAARQDVDALSSQMVVIQAAEGASMPKITFDLMALLEKLRQPLPDDQKPTPVPPIITPPPFPISAKASKTLRKSMPEELN